MKHMLMGVAAVALAAAPAMGQGASHGNGNGQGKAEHGPSMKAVKEDRGPPEKAPARPDRGPSMKAAIEGDRGSGPSMHAIGKDAGKPDKAAARIGERVQDAVRPMQAVERLRRDAADDGNRRGLVDGCPPGLAKKNPRCVPPGLARQGNDRRYRYAGRHPDWWGLGSLGLVGDNYFYDDGYLLRMNGGRVSGYVPLLGGALSIGNPWPSSYAPQPVPDYYVDYYGLGPTDGYRYADNVLYRIDPETAAITSIAALLTGDDIQVGQPMPAGYDVYNVPYPYRLQYADGPDARYRYSDGYVYQMDPETRLVSSAIELLAS